MIRAARKRRLGILALAAMIGTTAGGRSRAVTAADLASTITSAVRLGARIGDLAAGLPSAASRVATFGVVYATVMAGMEPATRRSILSAVDGWSGIGQTVAPPSIPVVSGSDVSRCAVKRAAAPVRRCSRA